MPPPSALPRRAIRFARALALASGGLTGASACAGDADAAGGPQTEAGPAIEGGHAAPSDAAPAADGARAETDGADALAGPRCVEDEYSIACAAGAACYVEQRYGTMRCDPPDGGVNKPCGAIACGWLCACTDPATSTCFCYADGGPLAPPELPRRVRAARRARRRLLSGPPQGPPGRGRLRGP